METIKIFDKNKIIIIKLDEKKIQGNIFEKNKILPLSNDIIKYFSFFQLSSNHTILKKEKKYQVILDNKTNFKHFFINNEEDFITFFMNNGFSPICYNKKNIDISTIKNFIIEKKNIIIQTSLKGIALILTIGMLTTPIKATALENNYSTININTIKKMIFSSPFLTQDEKNYLFNQDFFEDFIEYFNYSSYFIKLNQERFKNIRIISYDYHNQHYNTSGGYYNPSSSNTINIKNYDNLNENNSKDVLSHEFIHLCQNDFHPYRLIDEAMAEILSYEYFDDTYNNSYQNEIYLVRKLMEIIGPKPLLKYNFLNDFCDIEKEVKKYLTEKEYNEFLFCLKSYDNEFDKKYHQDRLNDFLNKMYYAKYEEPIISDKVIPHLREHDMARYYFNQRKINEENSYYCERIFQKMRLNEALQNGYLEVSLNKEKKTNIDEINELKKDYHNEKKYIVIIREKKDNKIEVQMAKITYPFDKLEGNFELFLQTSQKLDYELARKYMPKSNETLTIDFKEGIEGFGIDTEKDEVYVVVNKEKHYLPTILERQFDEKKKGF